MRAFDFVITLYSFVYALGIAQILARVGDIVRAGKRVRFSWLNAGWTLNILLAIVAWWISLWDLRAEKSWPMPTVLIFFAVVCLLYLLARLVSAPIPQDGSTFRRITATRAGNMPVISRSKSPSPCSRSPNTDQARRIGCGRMPPIGRRSRLAWRRPSAETAGSRQWH